MRHKTDFARGLETILNNPKTSFLKEPKTFNEIHNQSGMSLSMMIKSIGKSSKGAEKRREPTDDEKIAERMAIMKGKTEN
jgi:hypothetical protein